MSQRGANSRDDLAEEGLPTADDYDPDALGTARLSAGEPEQEWPQFGLEIVPVQIAGANYDEPTDTGRRLVMRNGEYLADVSDEYKLLPNERAVSVANDVARELGAEPFHEFDGDWFIELDDHVFQDQERRRVHALYAWDQGTIGGTDDVEYGFGVHNSIDGSQSFSVGLFTFRHACENMVFMGTSSRTEQRALRVEEDREILNQTSHQHTQGLDVEKDELKAIIKGTLTLLEDVDATYERWVQETVTPRQIAGLIDRLPQDDLPGWIETIPDELDYAAANEGYDDPDDMPWERRAEVIRANAPATEAVWDTYNDLTQNIWHGGSANDRTRREKMKDVHRVFNPVGAGDTNVSVR